MRAMVVAVLVSGCAAPQGSVRKSFSKMSLEELLEVKVTTASQIEESLREAPAPVTVITAEMIRASGARNLRGLLTTYVPGMTRVTDHNEMNVAMRGVYASSQQKILVLLNGHRLNSHAYNSANPDYGISLDLGKVKQIEVLRGPGSSLYGNVALTAVINIVTNSGAEVNGATVTAGGGDYISRDDNNPIYSSGRELSAGRGVALTYGKSFDGGHDVLMWATAFGAYGQRIAITPEEDYSDKPNGGTAILDGVALPSSYDLGLTYSIGKWSMLASARRGASIEPFSGAGNPTGEAFDYDAYRAFEGRGPGLAARSTHMALRYKTPLPNDFTLEVEGSLDTDHLAGQPVTDPATRSSVILGWRDRTFGGLATLRHDYETDYGDGNFLSGVQIERMRLVDSTLLAGMGGAWMAGDLLRPVLEPGVETTGSAFVMSKHRWSEQWLTNVGLRFDYKDRHQVDPALLMPGEEQPENLTDLSPRAAVIYQPSETIDLKLSYARSFVDAPYWYRYNSFPAYQGARTLKPERLDSVQLTTMTSFLDRRLQSTTNIFFNHVHDFVFRLVGGAGAATVDYGNAGVLDTIGFEQEVAYLEEDYRVFGNATIQQVLNAEDVGADEESGRINNVPRFAGNLVGTWRPVPSFNEITWVMLGLHYVGFQRAPIAPTWRLENGVVTEFSDPGNAEKQRLLVDLGLRATDLLVQGLDADITAFNLFDTRYKQGGTVVHPYPQAGRCYFASLSYRFDP